jgi:hypothetical protein
MIVKPDQFQRAAFFVEECKRLNAAGIPVYVIAGNHDPLREQPDLFELPQNVKIFGGNEPETYPVLGRNGQTIARVIGQSYLGRADSRRMHLGYHPPDTGIWNIGLLHTQLDSGSSTYVPCSLSELKEKHDIHYWALGHIHKPQLLSKSIPVVSYSGIPQGRDFGEEGLGGCILVELAPFKEPKLSFIPTSSVVFKRVEVWIDSDTNNIPETISELEDKISNLADQFIEEDCGGPGDIPINGDETNPTMGYVVQWVIKGRGKIHDVLMEQQDEISHDIAQELRRRYQGSRPFLWTDSVDIRTQKVLPDIREYEHTPFFRELNNVVRECMESAPMKKQLIRQMGHIWDERGDYENVEDYRFVLDDDTYGEIVQDAVQLILEKLLEGEEGI